MAKEFKTGDTVVLISGGPKMVVDYKDGKHFICKWFCGTKLEIFGFRPETIIPAKKRRLFR